MSVTTAVKYKLFNDNIMDISNRYESDLRLRKQIENIKYSKSSHIKRQKIYNPQSSSNKIFRTITDENKIPKEKLVSLKQSTTQMKNLEIPRSLSKSKYMYKFPGHSSLTKNFADLKIENKHYFDKLYTLRNKFSNNSNLFTRANSPLNKSLRSIPSARSGKSVQSMSCSIKSNKSHSHSNSFSKFIYKLGPVQERLIESNNLMLSQKIANYQSPLSKKKLLKMSLATERVADRIKKVKTLKIQESKKQSMRMLLEISNRLLKNSLGTDRLMNIKVNKQIILPTIKHKMI